MCKRLGLNLKLNSFFFPTLKKNRLIVILLLILCKPADFVLISLHTPLSLNLGNTVTLQRVFPHLSLGLKGSVSRNNQSCKIH